MPPRVPTRTLLSATAALALLITAVPAHASQKMDITGYQVEDLVVTNPYCYPVSTTLKTNKNATPSMVEVQVARKGKNIASALYPKSNKTRLISICPATYGFGAYTVGEAAIYSETKVKSKLGISYSKTTKHVDHTKKTFHVRAKTSSKLTSKRSGSKVTLAATAKTYVLGAWEHQPYKNAKAQLQVKQGKKWKTIKTLKMAKGKATVKLTDRKKKTYRLHIPQTTVSTATSSTTTR